MGLKFGAKIVVNLFYYHKQKLSSDKVREYTVKCFLNAKVKRKLIDREIVGEFFLLVFVLCFGKLNICALIKQATFPH